MLQFKASQQDGDRVSGSAEEAGSGGLAGSGEQPGDQRVDGTEYSFLDFPALVKLWTLQDFTWKSTIFQVVRGLTQTFSGLSEGSHQVLRSKSVV